MIQLLIFTEAARIIALVRCSPHSHIRNGKHLPKKQGHAATVVKWDTSPRRVRSQRNLTIEIVEFVGRLATLLGIALRNLRLKGVPIFQQQAAMVEVVQLAARKSHDAQEPLEVNDASIVVKRGIFLLPALLLLETRRATRAEW
jgi:hypothetical protein